MLFNASEQTISWLREEHTKGSLIIQPSFQRKPVWAEKQKCYLIESILMNLPVPEIYIQRSTTAEGQTTYTVVDGQQRIRTVLQFIGFETDPDQVEFNDFVLDKLDAASPWKDASFSELPDVAKQAYYTYRFSVRFLDTASLEDVRDMFRRLNKFLTPLKPQELRNATYSGPFVGLVETLADYDYWIENKLVSAALIRRMTDLEYVSELLIGLLHGPQGGSSRIIDEYYLQYEDYEVEFPEQKAARLLFDRTLKTIEQIFPDLTVVDRWNNRTDFYSLFVSVAALLRLEQKPASIPDLNKALSDFAMRVSAKVTDEGAKVPIAVANYAKAVQKGANDKARRAERHTALLRILKPLFSK